MNLQKNEAFRDVSGVEFNYYFICKRKLFLFSKGITFEKENEDVKIGKQIEEAHYSRERKNKGVEIINIDAINFKAQAIYEIKKSDKNKESDIWQIKYYMYYLKKAKGIHIEEGILRYPKEHKVEKVVLTRQDILTIENIIAKIEDIKNQREMPSKIYAKICKKCSYYEFCYV